ncbi:MAG: OmpA family protein [Saprospiraceae bacterium]|nr:OmpA family protein [Lewinella sp.]
MRKVIQAFSILLTITALSSCVSIQKYRYLERRVTILEKSLQDSDKDGVIDGIDQEDHTPDNAEVDTKGRTLDSDKDGVPNYRDREPYDPPRTGEEVDDDGVVVNRLPRPGTGTNGVTEERVREIVDEVLSGFNLSSGSTLAEWFLPMIHFGAGSSKIEYNDYGTLASVGRVVTHNPEIRLVVEGHADDTGPTNFNNYLSYQRAKAVVDHLESFYGISRGQLVILWKGNTIAIVPAKSSYLNRRVEFRVANYNDYEIDPPPKPPGKK